MRRITNALILASAALIAAGGFIHLREWLETYRDVPSEAPGAFVVRVGFPVNAGLSFVLALALLTTVLVARRFQLVTIAAAFGFQAGSLAVLIGTRAGTVLGWTEPTWTPGANQTRAVEIGALLCLAAAAYALRLGDRPVSTPTLAEALAEPSR